MTLTSEQGITQVFVFSNKSYSQVIAFSSLLKVLCFSIVLIRLNLKFHRMVRKQTHYHCRVSREIDFLIS